MKIPLRLILLGTVLLLTTTLHAQSLAPDIVVTKVVNAPVADVWKVWTTAEGIERLWQASMPLLEAPPPVRLYSPGSWGPNAIHQLIAPRAWRLPFERAWREAKNDNH